MSKFSLLLVLLLSSLVFAWHEKRDDFGPKPFEYEGNFYELVPGDTYELKGILVPLDQAVVVIDSHGMTRSTLKGFQIDLRYFPVLGRGFVTKLNEGHVYPVFSDDANLIKPFTYVRAVATVYADMVPCISHCEGLFGLYHQRNILSGSLKKIPFSSSNEGVD